MIASISAVCPNVCTGIIAFVFSVIFSLISSGSILYVLGSTSMKMGFASQYNTECPVAGCVKSATRTSSPFSMPIPSSDKCSAAVQFVTATAYFAPTHLAKASSNSFVFGPCETQPDSRTSLISSNSSSSKYGLVSGIFSV